MKRELGSPLRAAVLATTTVLLFSPSSGHAQDQPPPASAPAPAPTSRAVEPVTPWSQDVPAPKRRQALAMFRQGNQAYTKTRYKDAARIYRAALEVWDHPAIHGNLAVVLIHLDDPVGAYRHLKKALAYGPAPLDHRVYQQLTAHRRLLQKQIARVEIVSRTRGARVLVNGRPALAGAGRIVLEMRIGGHLSITAHKPGFVPFTRNVHVLPGQTAVTVKLVPERRRRFAAWMPWIVIGTGAVLLATGTGLELSSRSKIKSYEEALNQPSCLDPPLGCHDSELGGDGVLENRLAIGAFVAGGITLVSGVILTLLNQPRVVVDEGTKAPLAAGVSLAPWLSTDGGGLSLSGSY